MNNESIERWLEPRLVPVLLVVAVVCFLSVGGGVVRGIAQDARMLLGAAGDVSRFVTHLVDEAERYFQQPQDDDQHHLTYASVAPPCPSVAAEREKVMAARGSALALRELNEIQFDLEAMNDTLLIQFEWLNNQEWPSLEVLEDHPFLQAEVRMHVVTPARAPRPQVVM